MTQALAPSHAEEEMRSRGHHCSSWLESQGQANSFPLFSPTTEDVHRGSYLFAAKGTDEKQWLSPNYQLKTNKRDWLFIIERNVIPSMLSFLCASWFFFFGPKFRVNIADDWQKYQRLAPSANLLHRSSLPIREWFLPPGTPTGGGLNSRLTSLSAPEVQRGTRCDSDWQVVMPAKHQCGLFFLASNAFHMHL